MRSSHEIVGPVIMCTDMELELLHDDVDPSSKKTCLLRQTDTMSENSHPSLKENPMLMRSPVSPIILCGPLPLGVLCCVQESKQTKRILLLLLELDRPGPTGPGPAVCTTEFFVRHKAFVGPERKKKNFILQHWALNK